MQTEFSDDFFAGVLRVNMVSMASLSSDHSSPKLYI